MAQITIGNQILHAIDPRIYSHFIEELGECIHNGIWVYSDALKNLPILEDPQLDLVRQDVFQSMYDIVGGQASHRGLLRWPGGCFSDTYHWRDGIGPREATLLASK